DTISRWSTEDGSLLASRHFPVSPEGLNLVGDRLVETSVNGIRILRLPNLTFEQSSGRATAFAPDGILFAVSKSAAIEIWQAGNPPSLFKSIETGGHYRFLFSPDSKLLAIDKTNGSVEIWDLDTGKVLQTFSIGTSRRIEQIAFTPDNTRLYAITRRSYENPYNVDSLIGWKVTDGSSLPTRSVKCNVPITISSDSKLLAYSDEQGSQHGRIRGCRITIYRIEGWLPIQTLDEVSLTQLSFSPDNTLLATTSRSGGIRIWNVVDGKLLRTIVDNPFDNTLYTNVTLNSKAGHSPKGQFGISLSFSPDGKYLLRTADGVAYLWGVPGQ
ncbi:MAG TPA: hypothetical protein VJL59_26095, partial [Anaerolineales bacterium]|nr:hypothetical protein [Anaerolineales bacterium]